MMLAKNGIVALYKALERYNLNNPCPYIAGNMLQYFNLFVFRDWVFMLHMFILIFLDTILGVWVALKKREFSSSKFGKVITKTAVYLIVLIATHNAGEFFVGTGAGFLIKFFDSTIYAAIIIREYISLLEKLPVLGIWKPPDWILNRLKVWQDTGKLDDNEK